MRMAKMMAGIAATALAVCASTAVAATGSSGWFFVDTTNNELKISDVTSRYFDGEYGGKTGRKSTFLSGTPCEIEMTIVMDDDSEVDHWRVNGSTVTEKTFKFNVGALPVGGRLEVVAVGKKEGVNSNTFRANFEVAEHVGNAGMWGARPSNSGGIDEIVYTPLGGGLTLSFSPEMKGDKPDQLNWLPGDEWALAPKFELKPEVHSDGNGSFTSGSVGIGGNINGSSVEGGALKKMISAGKAARVLDHDIGMSFTGGPIALSWNPKRRRWVAEEVSFTGEANGSIGWTHYIPTVMGPVFIEGKLEAALAATFKVSGMSAGLGGLESSFVLSSDRLPKVSVAGGYGINNVANVKATISGMSVLEATHNKGTWTDVKWGLRGSGALTAKFLPFEATLFELTSETLWIINNSSAKSARLLSAASADGLDWRLQPRDYLGTMKRGQRLMAAPVGDGCAVVESGGYPEAAPAMASGVKGDALAYLRDNAARSSANRTELVLRTGANNEWNAAEVVWDDGTADFLPSLAAMPDGSVVAAWMNAARTFSDDVTIDEFCGAEEIAVGIRNAATGAWTCRNLTSDSAFDFSPVVRAAANGKVLVAWLRNSSGKLTSSATEPTDIMAAVYANGQWGGATVVRRGVGVATGFDVAFDGERAVLAFSKDADGNPDTVGDIEMYALRMSGGAWGSPVRLTAAGDADGVPFVRADGDGGFAVLWTEKGVLMETRELAVSTAVAVAAAEGYEFPAIPALIRGAGGRDALVWNDVSSAGGPASAPTAMMYDPVCGAWGAPVKLFDDGRRESRLSGAVGVDGGLRIGYESASVATNAAGEVSFGATEVRTWFKPAACDLAVVEDGFSFSTDEFTFGEEVLLTVKAANLGFGTATDATVRVFEEKGGGRTELGSVVTNFPGGGVVAVQVPWVVDNAQNDLVFTVEIDAGANEEAEDAKDNNTYSWAAGTPYVSFGAVSVRSESETRRLLTATVVNRGLGPLPAGAKIVFRRGGEDGEILAEDTVGEVWPGADGAYAAGFSWDIEGVAFTSEWETVCVQLYPEGTVGTALDAADIAYVQVKTTMSGTDPEVTTYTVTYKPGANGTGSQQTATKTKDVVLTLKGATFTRTGYAQTGWATSDGGAKVYDLGASYTANAAATLYPFWTPSGNEPIWTIENGVLMAVDLNGCTDITIPDNVTSIGYHAFYNCGWLTSVTISGSVKSIGNEAFWGCSRLRNVTIPDSVTSVGRAAFAICSGLVSVTIGNGVTIIEEGVFSDCRGLTNVVISGSVTRIMDNAFAGCHGLTSVAIPGSVTSIGNLAFSDCRGLASVTIPDSVTSIGYRVFDGCNDSLFDTTTISGVKLVDGWAIGNTGTLWGDLNLTGIRGVGPEAFRGCSGLTSVKIGGTVARIGADAFYDCTGLVSVTILDPIADIGTSAFQGCNSMTSVTMPNSLTSIGIQAFCNCSELTSVTMKSDCPTVGWFGFKGVNPSCVVYLPKGNATYMVTDGKWQGMTVMYYDAETANVVVDAAKGTVAQTDGGYVVTAVAGVTLTEGDITFVAVAKEAYTVTIAEGGKSATVTLNEPVFGAAAEDAAARDAGDPTGALVEVADDKIEAKPAAKVGETVGALPVKTYAGLWYQAAWGDGLDSLTPGEKVKGTGETLYLGVIRQTGEKGFYKVTVSEK